MNEHPIEYLSIKTPSSEYPVIIGENILDHIPELLTKSKNLKKVLLISDMNTHNLFSEEITEILLRNNIAVSELTVKPGEESKSLETYGEVLEHAAQHELTRGDAMMALGGGVVGDLTGFAAGTYLRGIDFYQIPTTLLAMVDSSVGGKTGINLRSGKNLAGVFRQPGGVLCDTNYLKTLHKSMINDGVSEIIKYGMIRDKELFDMLDPMTLNRDLLRIVKKCLEIKALLVGEDEFDTGKRQLLNLGHTLGHAIEKLSGYRVTHGQAVAIGMAMIARSSYASGLCSGEAVDELLAKLKSFDLPVHTEYGSQEIYEVTLRDKKRTGRAINLIIPKAIGEPTIYKIDIDEFPGFIERGRTI